MVKVNVYCFVFFCFVQFFWDIFVWIMFQFFDLDFLMVDFCFDIMVSRVGDVYIDWVGCVVMWQVNYVDVVSEVFIIKLCIQIKILCFDQ